MSQRIANRDCVCKLLQNRPAAQHDALVASTVRQAGHVQRQRMLGAKSSRVFPKIPMLQVGAVASNRWVGMAGGHGY